MKFSKYRLSINRNFPNLRYIFWYLMIYLEIHQISLGFIVLLSFFYRFCIILASSGIFILNLANFPTCFSYNNEVVIVTDLYLYIPCLSYIGLYRPVYLI